MVSESADAGVRRPTGGGGSWADDERLYRQIVEKANEAIWVCDLAGVTTYANAMMAELVRYSHEQMAGLTLFDVLDEPGRVQAADFLQRQRQQQGSADKVECSYLRRDGSRIWVLVSHSPLYDNGRHIGFVSVVSEITDRKLADDKLRRSKEQLAQAQRVAHLGSWDWDILNDELTWSDEMYRMFGLQPQEFDATYQAFTQYVHPEDRTRVDDSVGRALTGPGGFENRYRIVRPDGVVLWIHAAGEVLRDSTGAPLRMHGTALDISAFTAAEMANQRARDAALESSRLKSEFLSTMSHEIRTPMNGVIGLTGLLLGTALDETQRRYAEGVHGAGEALLVIINDILDFSKIEAGKLELETVDLDVIELAEQAAALIAHEAQTKGVKLVVDARLGRGRQVRGDPGRLRQVLLNLVANAVKFTDRGEVVLRARLVEEADSGAVLRFEIVDTGIGIAEGDQHRLFEAFSQVDASTTRRFGGTGLGLAICRRLVAAMGGELQVESEPGKGSIFSFTLRMPYAEGPAATASDSPPSQVQDLVPETACGYVLVAEDNLTNQVVAQGILQHLGYRVDIAANGHEALQALSETDYAAVLMDCQMPGMDGYAATHQIRLREGPSRRRTPVIAMTANAMRGDKERCLSAGMDDYITKPVVPEDLAAALTRWIPRTRDVDGTQRVGSRDA